MAEAYNPLDWYWTVGGDQSQVYSSARGNFVPVADSAYGTWLSRGNAPTAIDTSANLGQVLASYSPMRPVHAGVLDAFQAAQAESVMLHLNFKLIFNLWNRVNVLEGKPSVTPAQARAALKAMM